LVLDRSRKYTNPNLSLNKPDGLWISIGSAWARWCHGEEFGLDRLLHKSVVDVDLGRVLLMKNNEDILSFEKQYRCAESWIADVRYVEWGAVALDYSGVILVNYDRDFIINNAGIWSWGWDCSSGVIWDLSAIKEIINV
jgi:hypothetical protein